MTGTNLSTIKVPHFLINEKTGRYKARRSLSDKEIIKAAKALLARKINGINVFTEVGTVRDYLITQYSEYKHEVFICLFCDTQHRLITDEVMFRGTIDGASVYPREVVRRAIELNAAAVIFSHNHPSGSLSPSLADKHITSRLIASLSLIDVKVLDHLIVGAGDAFSFAEHQLM